MLPVRSLSCLKRISIQNTLSAKHIYNCFRSFCPACFFNVFHSFCSPFLSILPIEKRSAAARFPCAAAFALPAKRRSVFSGKNMEFPLSGLTFSRILHIITVSQKQYGRGVPVPRGQETERSVQALRWGRRRWLPCSGAEPFSKPGGSSRYRGSSVPSGKFRWYRGSFALSHMARGVFSSLPRLPPRQGREHPQNPSRHRRSEENYGISL